MKLVSIFIIVSGIAIGQTKYTVVTLPLPEDANYFSSQVEPSIAIHPKKTNIIAAGSVMDDYYLSKDGGKTWKSTTIKSKFGVNGDPVLTFDQEGKLYYFHLSNYSKGSYLDRIVCQKARCGYRKFNQGTFPTPNGTKVQDKQWVVIDQHNTIHMTWTQFDAYNSADPMDSSVIVYSKSSDQGKSWSLPKRISKYAGDCLDDDNTVEGAVPAIGPNGEIYVCWTGPKGLMFQKSLDNGENWFEAEMFVDQHYGGWTLEIPGINRANGLPILKCDISHGPNRGRLYLNWCDQRNGEDDTDVLLSYSDDQGKTWSKPKKVNQDESGNHQIFTWMSIDSSNGYLYFVYYDRRNYETNETDVFLSRSKDGGMTFTDERISDKPFIPSQDIFFGDYLNIDAVNGKIVAIWPRMDNRKISLQVTLIDN